MTPSDYLVFAVWILAAIACVGWILADQRAGIFGRNARASARWCAHEVSVAKTDKLRAESACEELRKQVMRGSAVASVERHSTNSRADRRLDVAVIAGEPHAFTDSILPRARELYAHCVDAGEIKPITPTTPQK